jgi:indolepyruvate ferredoxin oxidoreductase
VQIASIPEKIRGFGPVKERHLGAAKGEESALLAQFRAGEAVPPVAAAAE